MEAGSRDEGRRGPARAGADAQNPRVSLRPIAISGSSTETTLDIRFDRRANTGTQLFGSRSRYEVAGPVALPLARAAGGPCRVSSEGTRNGRSRDAHAYAGFKRSYTYRPRTSCLERCA